MKTALGDRTVDDTTANEMNECKQFIERKEVFSKVNFVC